MGMYDYLNGEQIKCFYGVVHYKDSLDSKWEFSHSGGQLRGYVNGSELPLKTFHYNYPKDFLILDENDGILHTIKDGKLFNTEPLRMVESIDDNLLKSVYSYHGLELNINSLEELKEYPKKVSERVNTINSMYKKYKPSSSKLIKAFRFTKDNVNKLEDIIFLLEDDDYKDLNKFFDSLNLKLNLSMDSPIKSRLMLKLLLDSKDDSEATKDFIKNKASELFHRFNNRQEEEEKELNKFLNPYLEAYNKRWIKNNCFKTEEKIGSYISVINELDELKKNSPQYFNDKDEESYDISLKELNVLVKEYGINSYINWLNPSNEELEIINNILNRL